MKKVTVVGAGSVGATCADVLAQKNFLDEVVLIDIKEGLAEGKALDIWESSAINHFDTRVVGSTNDYSKTEGSDVVVITSGIPRKPGMSRDDLISTNAKIVKSVTDNVMAASPDAIIIIISNPLDVMTYQTYLTAKLPANRVMGMAGVLDSARFRSFLSLELNVSVENIQTLVLGGHGDSMVPLPRYTTVAGIPIMDFISKERLETIVQRTRDGGAEIVKLLKTGSAYYAPSAAIVEMVEAIMKDKNKILPCSALCEGEFGLNDVFVGVPVQLGGSGIAKILEVALTAEEQKALQASAETVQSLCATVDEALYS